MHRTALFFTLILLFSSLSPAGVIRVPDDQPAIQNAIDAAEHGDEVVVADGVYTGHGNREIDFLGKAITVRSASGPANCIIDCQSDPYGERYRGVLFTSGEGRDSVLRGFTIRNGLAPRGGAIYCENASPVIEGNVITDNGASWPSGSVSGGGICAVGGAPLITGSIISHNTAGAVIDDWNNGSGGGIACIDSAARIENCLIVGNFASGWTAGSGGGMKISGGGPVISGCTFSGNSAFGGHYLGDGGAIYAYGGPYGFTVENSIFWHDEAIGEGPEIALRDAFMAIAWCAVEGGEDAMFLDTSILDWGPGMIDADPLFSEGLLGEYCLSQVAAGQSQDSPCVDTGDPEAPVPEGTTRTDQVQDIGVLDIGFHYPLPLGDLVPPETVILSGPNGAEDSPVCTFTFTGVDFNDPPETLVYSWRLDEGDWSPFDARPRATITDPGDGEHTFRVRARDSTGLIDPTPAERAFQWTAWSPPSGWARTVAGPGPGWYNPPLVRAPNAEWIAYGAGGFGVNVACGDVDGDGLDEVLTGPGPGRIYGPHVRGWSLDGSPIAGLSFLAYGTPRFGVNVAAADLDGDGVDEIISGAGPGAVYGPHVRGWSYSGSGCLQVPGVSFFAYGTHKWGVNVTGGDVDGDGIDEMVTGAGPGRDFGAHVRGWGCDSGAVAQLPGLSFFAYGVSQWGVNVGCGDIDGDGIDEIITGPGPGYTFRDHVRAFDYDGGGVTQVPAVSFFAIWGYYGARVSAADVDDDGIDEILSVPGAGPDNAAVVLAWNADGGEVSAVPGFYELIFTEWMTHGGTVAGVRAD